MKKMVLEPFMGLLLIAMVFLAVQYGGVEVLFGGGGRLGGAAEGCV